jgi:membrane protein YdbS with pleckstrin-like domain
MNNIKNNNTTHYEIRQHLIFLVVKIIFFEILITILHIILDEAILTHRFHDMWIWSMSGQVRELIMMHTITTIVIIYLVWQWVTNYYSINESTITHESGIITKQNNSIDVNGIQEIDYMQGFWWRLFNYWTLIVINPLAHWKIYLKKIPKPNYYAKLIKSVQDNNILNRSEQIIVPHTNWSNQLF